MNISPTISNMEYEINKKKIASNTIALYIRMGITMIISFFVTRVTLQQLGVEDYGLNNLVGGVVSMFSFLNGSMGTAVQRFYSYEIGRREEEKLGKIFGVSLYLHTWIAIVTVVMSEVFAIFFLSKLNIPAERMTAANIVFQISILSLALNIINVPYSALLRAREMFSKTAVVEIIQSILRLAVLYLLVVVDFDKLIVLAFLNLLITIYYVGALTIMARKYKEARNGISKDSELIKQMTSFISLLVITVLAQLAKTNGLIMLVNVFFGLTVNAAYAIALQVSNLLNTFVLNFKQSMVPQIMAAYGSGDAATMQRLINTGTKLTFIMMLVISTPIIFTGEFLLKLWLDVVPEHTSFLVSLVLIYINVASFTYFHYQGVHATGNIKKQQIRFSLLYLLNIVLIYLAFKIGFNFEWALYINIIISFIQCGINLYYAKITYQYNIPHFLCHILMPCILIVTVVAISEIAIMHICESLIISFVFSVVTTLLISVTMGYFLLMDNSERILLINILAKAKKRYLR